MAATKRAAKKTTRMSRKVVVRKKETAKKPQVKKQVGPIKDAMTKSQILATLAETTDLTKKQISNVFEGLANLIERHVKQKAAGEFTVPGLLKIKVVHKPATKARTGINPFTGLEAVFKAKPARNVVKIKPLKKLKDMV